MLNRPEGVDVAADGSIYIADFWNARIRRVGPDGIITTVAGTGIFGFNGDGGPATAAQLKYPGDVAVGPDGSLFVADTHNYRVRRIDPNGTISTVAGTGVWGHSGDGGPAVAAQVFPLSVVAAPDGSLYITETYAVRRVGPDGIITTVAGNASQSGFAGDGGPATQALLAFPYHVALAPDGSFYIADYDNNRIRRVGTDGIITTIAGNGNYAYAGDGGPATAASFQHVSSVALSPEGILYVADIVSERVRRIALTVPGASVAGTILGSKDGSEAYVFDVAGRQARTVNALTGASRYVFGYDAAGWLASVSDGHGNLTRIERDSAGQPTAIVAPGGQRTSLHVNPEGYLDEVTDPANKAHRLGYGAGGVLTGFTDRNDNPRTMQYDEQSGRLTRDANPAGGFWAASRTPLANGWSTSLTSALGRASTYRVERAPDGGKLHVNTGPDGLTTSTVFAIDGSRTTTAPNGTTTTVVEGPDPRWGMQAPLTKSLTTRRPSGVTSTMTRTRTATLSNPADPFSLQTLTDTIVLNGRTYTRQFDSATRRLTLQSPVGRTYARTLDALGRVVREEIPGVLPLETVYNEQGRPTVMSQGSRRFEITYDPLGRAEKVVDPLLHETTFGYDAGNRVMRLTDPAMAELWLGHDGNGNITSVAPPGRPAHSFAYDRADLIRSYTRPPLGEASAATLYSYDLDRSLTEVADADSEPSRLSRDGAGRVAGLSVGTRSVAYSYDPMTAQLSTASDGQGQVVSYTYDGSLPTSTTLVGEVSASTTRVHDENLYKVWESVGGQGISYEYDNDGLLTRAGELVVARDPTNGRITGTTLGGTTDSYEYDEYGALRRYSALFGETLLYDAQYVRDAVGRITRKTETTEAVTRVFEYEYDLAGRLWIVRRNGSVTAVYLYDANGNRVSASGEAGEFSGQYDDRDRLVSYGDAAYHYTDAGQLLTKTNPSGTTTYEFDARGQLRGALTPGGTRVDYVLDAMQRRVGKRVNGTLVERRVYGSALEVLAELDETGAVAKRYAFLDPLGAAAYMKAGGHIYRIVSDHLGSARRVVDVDTGEVMQHLDYDEWGNILQDSNAGFQPFAFTGREWDAEVGLYYYRARYYDPRTGRFISEDPIHFLGGVNFYSYVHNSPVNFVDPFGLHTLTFNGGGVTFRGDAGEFLGYIPATSGRDGVTDPSVPWKGPIPEGQYELNPSDITRGGVLRDLTGDWGEWRVPLKPLPGTDTKGRDGFFLHGGEKPGSAGCIDVGKRDRHLFPPLVGHDGPVKVIVKYPEQYY